MTTPRLLLTVLFALAIGAAWIDREPKIEDRVKAGLQFHKISDQDLWAENAVHLIYWEKWNGFEGEAMQACVDAFNAHGKNALSSQDSEYRRRFLSPSEKRIIVHLLSVTQVNQKTLLAVSGGTPPDVAGLWSRDVPVYAQYQAAMSLDHWIQRDASRPLAPSFQGKVSASRMKGVDPAEYQPCFWSMCVYEGHVWALPTTPATVALHWNKELFKKAGLDPERPPKTLAEFDAFNEKLTRRDDNGRIVQMGFLPSEPGWWNYAWGNWFGGKHASTDGRTITCDSPEWIAAYEWLNKIARSYGRSELIALKGGMGNFDSPQNGFISGKVAMVLQGVWMANFIRRYNPAMKWGAAPFPGPAGTPNDPVTLAQADVLIIPRDCPHPEEAWKFISYVNSRGDPDDPHAPLEGMEIVCLGQGKNTPFKSTSTLFRQKHRHESLQVFMDLAGSRNAIIEPMMPMWNEYREACISSFEELWTKGDDPGHSPREILKNLKERMQSKLDREWERIDRNRHVP